MCVCVRACFFLSVWEVGFVWGGFFLSGWLDLCMYVCVCVCCACVCVCVRALLSVGGCVCLSVSVLTCSFAPVR